MNKIQRRIKCTKLSQVPRHDMLQEKAQKIQAHKSPADILGNVLLRIYERCSSNVSVTAFPDSLLVIFLLPMFNYLNGYYFAHSTNISQLSFPPKSVQNLPVILEVHFNFLGPTITIFVGVSSYYLNKHEPGVYYEQMQLFVSHMKYIL